MKCFITSFSRKEKAAEKPIIRSVSLIGTAGKFGIPAVTIRVVIAKLSTMADRRVLLGKDFQKCPRSRTLKIRKMAE